MRRPERAGPASRGEPIADLLPVELMRRVSQIQLRTHRLVNDVLSGAYRSSFRGSGVEFAEVRRYQPGDDVRSIDWNRTAKMGEAYIKNYVEERELTLALLVDTSGSMDFGSREYSKREAAASLCALLAFVALRQQDRVGLTLFGETPGLHLQPRKGAGAVARVVREVIAARPTGGGTDFRAVLETQERTLRRRSLIFLISDFLDTATSSAGRDWTQVAARLAKRHDVIAVRVIDPFEEELPPAGLLRFEDIESGAGQELDTRSQAVRATWSAAAAARRERLVGELLRARVELIELSTVGDLADPLVRFFRRRAHRMGGPA
jgi:uncharacterized protein (DUF58 family)